jgi:tetratricopeptide (TPR) repeat protein
MTSSAPAPPGAPAGPPSGGLRRRALLLFLVLLAGVGLWWGWRWYTQPAVPDIPLAGLDPAVAAAVRQAQEEVRQHPRSADAWGRLGMVLCGNLLHERAAAPLAQAAAFAPQDERWPYLLGVALTPFDPAAALPPLRRAAELCRSGDKYQAAAHLRLAEALLADGHEEEAEGHFRQVLALAPDHPCAHYGLGVLEMARGELTRSKDHLIRCAYSPLTRQKACSQLAALCKRLGDEKEAAAYAAAARQAAADIPWPDPFFRECLALAVGRKQLVEQHTAFERQGDMASALDVARELVRNYPDGQAYLTLGITLGRVGQYQESEECLRKCLELEPRLGRAQYYLSLALFGQGEILKKTGKKAESLKRFRESAAWARKATELNDRHAEAYFQLGLALTCLGERAGAIEAFRRAVRSRPELAEPHLWLGKALAKEGQTEEALVHLKNAVRLAPANDPRPRQALEEVRGKRKAGP